MKFADKNSEVEKPEEYQPAPVGALRSFAALMEVDASVAACSEPNKDSAEEFCFFSSCWR